MGMTAEQEAVWTRRQEGMTQQAIADELGLSRRTVRDRLARAEKHVDTDPAIREAMDHFGVEMQPDMLWIKDQKYSMKLKPKQADEVDFLERVKQAFMNIPAAPTVKRTGPIDTETMNVFPLFDAHLGMRAHAGVSGEEMDLERGAQRILDGLAGLMGSAPAAYKAVIINGGDFTHQTDDKNQTRRSGHILDVDGRNWFTTQEAIRVITASIEMALQTHEVVEYYSVPGNHDPQNWETILSGLLIRYADNPRVTIYNNFERHDSSEFSVIEHGEVAIFIHHGDKRTPKDLAMFCAAEFPEIWGRTRFRIVMTGHLHHIKVDEFPGIYWMQMPALAVRDQHAAGGYKSHSLIMCITFDRESECGRITRKL